MIFLVIGTSLVAGLYAMVSAATAITANEQRAAQALGAAETGMEFMRHQLSTAARAVSFSGSDSTRWIQPLADALGPAMNGTATLGGQSLAAPVLFVLRIPSVSLGDGTSFTAMLEPTSDARRLSLIVTGYSRDGLSRRLEIDFSGPPGGPVLFPIQSRVADGLRGVSNVNEQGQKGLTYTPTTVELNDGGTASVLLYPGMTAPSTMDFPDNTTLITAVAGLNLPARTDARGATIAGINGNFSVAPNSNYTLSGTINGIVYVRAPNAVKFGPSVVLNGTIVFERGTPGGSSLYFPVDGIIRRPMDGASAALQQSASGLADQLKWWSIIAPDADLTMPNGTTRGSAKVFEGSLNIHSFARQGSGNQTALTITLGGIVAEGTISLGSNGVMYAINPDTSSLTGSSSGSLSLVATSYQELLH